LLNVYWGVFLAGIAFAVLSFIFDFIGDTLNFEFTAGNIFLPLKPFFILIFITVFGGVGIIATYFVGPWLAMAPAGVMGFIIARPIDHLLTVRLRTYETKTPSEQDTIGVKATVIETIAAGGIGRISFILNDSIVTGSARDHNPHGNGFPKNTIVTIVKEKGNIYYVADQVSEDRRPEDYERRAN